MLKVSIYVHLRIYSSRKLITDSEYTRPQSRGVWTKQALHGSGLPQGSGKSGVFSDLRHILLLFRDNFNLNCYIKNSHTFSSRNCFIENYSVSFFKNLPPNFTHKISQFFGKYVSHKATCFLDEYLTKLTCPEWFSLFFGRVDEC